MKKYIAPSLKVVTLANENILAGSDPYINFKEKGNGVVLSRGRNAHYFEEEEVIEDVEW